MIESELIGQWMAHKTSIRVKLSLVGSRMIASPMAELGDILNFVLPADGVIVEDFRDSPRKKNPQLAVKLLHTREVIELPSRSLLPFGGRSLYSRWSGGCGYRC